MRWPAAGRSAHFPRCRASLIRQSRGRTALLDPT
jgi:hypothetical protein